MIPLNKLGGSIYIAALSVAPIITPAIAQPQEYTIKLTTAEVDIVGRSLGKLPYEDVALLIQKLREQIVSQQQNKAVDEKK